MCVRASIFSIDCDYGGDGDSENNGVLIPKYRVWYSLMSAYHSKLREFYTSLPHTMCKYQDSHKMWIFDFETYEHVISTLSSTTFPIVVSVEELPSFLFKGIAPRGCYLCRSTLCIIYKLSTRIHCSTA